MYGFTTPKVSEELIFISIFKTLVKRFGQINKLHKAYTILYNYIYL